MSFNTNPLYSSQWHFNLIGDIETIWAEFSGAGVVVAVYDDGVQYTHEDLNDNYDFSLELPFPYNDSFPDSGSMGHGTAVAGIIAGENNDVGGIGVSWGATLVGNDFFEGSSSASLDIAEIEGMANFDVINNSWGSSGFFSSRDLATNSALENAYAHVVETGRDGLGSIIVKSAGNEARGNAPSSQNDVVAVMRYSIVVGATDSNGDTADYSSWGTNLLVSAPAAAYTTDLTFGGYDGLPDTGYTNQFSGTSASAPVVSGVVALMLEANENLGWRDVQQILAVSASHTGSFYGSGPSGFEDGAWFFNGANNWNGGGVSYHINYGYGMVDAFAAVRMAEVWTIMHGEAMTSANEMSAEFFLGGFNQTISNVQAPVEASILIQNSEIIIESIYVEVDMTHTWSGDLTIVLVAPDGTEFVLHDQNGFSADHNGYTYTVSAALGMSSLGEWTLRITDNEFGDSGTFFGFGIEFFGSAPTNDDVYTFTDDITFISPIGVPGIEMFDTNGGVDWLNFAAFNGSIELLLSNSDGMISFDQFTTGLTDSEVFLNGAFENAAFGDGDDYVDMNDLNNHVLGGRGNDWILARFGNDTIEGGQGDDTLEGAWGNDSILGGSGLDRILGGGREDTIDGGTGGDRIFAGGGNDSVLGGLGADRIFGFNGNDTMDGGIGEDRIFGEAGFDSLLGGGDDDYIDGGGNADTILGGNGFDELYGGLGGDSMFGEGQGDFMDGGEGADYMDGGLGFDEMYGGNGADTMYGGVGLDYMSGGAGFDEMHGGADRDVMFGDGQADTLYGDDGDDRLFGGDGNDVLYGGADNDILRGNAQSDELFGEAGNDELFGGFGTDTLDGGADNDTLDGGFGDDILTGGTGGDVFVFSGAETGHDTITDFDSDQIGEIIDLTALGISQLTSTNTAEGALITWGDPNSSILLAGVFNEDLDIFDDFVF